VKNIKYIEAVGNEELKSILWCGKRNRCNCFWM